MNREPEPGAQPKPALEALAAETARRYRMLGGAVLAGVSGGADSMALLHWLCSLRKTGLRVFAAHINHMLRGEEALRDEETVRAFCKTLGVPLFVLRADVAARARGTGQSVEEAGRAVRYEFFAQKAAELEEELQSGGAGQLDAVWYVRVATAHTLSDRIETQLFNLARGTGLRGLCGIPPVRGRVVRPLLACTRRQTEEYCRCYGIKYEDDSTNFSRIPTRNRIRLELVPRLYEINPAFGRAEARLFDTLGEDEACLAAQARALLEKSRRGPGVYGLAELRQAPAAILRRCLGEAARRFTGRAQEYRHIAAAEEVVREGRGKTQLAGGGFVRVYRGALLFSRPETCAPQENTGFSFPFEPGIYRAPAFILTITELSGGYGVKNPEDLAENFKNINKRYFKNTVDCDKIKDNAKVRTRMPGDAFRPLGRNVSKTLKKLMNEAGVPAEKRAAVAVAADGEGVFWVDGFGVAERCKADVNTKRAYKIEIEHLEV